MQFELQPTLRGELLELRPLHADDFAALFAITAQSVDRAWLLGPEPG